MQPLKVNPYLTMQTIKINSINYDELIHINPVSSYKEVKNTILNEVIEKLDDTYYNLSEGVKTALDEMCFLAREKGFAYASPAYFMEKHDISKTAIYDLVKRLREMGLVIKANKSSRNHNGLGKWVIIFTSHPNFSKICDTLNIVRKAERKTERKAEIVETPCESKAEEEISDSTYLEPSSNQSLKDNVIHYNVDNVVKFYKYVPKSINNMFASVFGEDLVNIWRKVKQAVKKVNLSLEKEEVLEIGRIVINNLFVRVKKTNMSADEMCAYIYKATLNMIYNQKGNLFLEDMVVEEDTYYYSSVNSLTGYNRTQFEVNTKLMEKARKLVANYKPLPLYDWTPKEERYEVG